MSHHASTVSLRPPGAGLWLRPGMVATVVGAVVIAVLWMTLLPADKPLGDRVGETLGVEAIWLMSAAMLSITQRPAPARLFGGIDAQLWWHRVAGTLGFALAIVHPRIMATRGEPSLTATVMEVMEKVTVLLIAWAFLAPGTRAARWRGPLGWIARSSYDIWRIMHAVLAVYVLVAMYHGFVDAELTPSSVALRAVYVVVCAYGVWAVLDRTLARHARGWFRNGTVTQVHRLSDLVAMVHVKPDRDRGFLPGHFVYLGLRSARERAHPFTVAGVSPDGELELGVKASGRGTRRLVERVAVGDRVWLSAPQGSTDPVPHEPSNVWVAGGAGIAPMIATIRTAGEDGPGGRVTLLWSRRDAVASPMEGELLDSAARYPWLTVRFIDTTAEPRVSAADVLTAGGVDADQLGVRMCGPTSMMQQLASDLRRAGVAAERLHVESYSFR